MAYFKAKFGGTYARHGEYTSHTVAGFRASYIVW